MNRFMNAIRSTKKLYLVLVLFGILTSTLSGFGFLYAITSPGTWFGSLFICLIVALWRMFRSESN